MKPAVYTRVNQPTSLHHLMFVLQHLTNELLESEVKVGLSQVRIMSALQTNKPYSQRGVAIKLRQTEANVSRQLRTMQHHGLVSITKNSKDKRQKEITLTAKGKKVYDNALRLLNAQQKDLLRVLSKNQARVFDETVDTLLIAIA